MIINSYVFGLDPDAQAFLTATGITDATISGAINTLTLSLKGNNLWVKMKAVYPFVGGTATTHKYNLKNPLDTNAAFRLTFNGGWTHSSTGALPNGINGNANTHALGNTDIILNNTGFGLYNRTNTQNISAFGIDSNFHIHQRYTNNQTYWRIFNGTGFTNIIGTSLGLFHGYSNSGNVSTAFYNGTLQGTYTGNNAINSLNLFFGGGNSIFTYDNRQIAFGFISLGLNNTEASNLYTLIQTFQTTLSRQV
jgi:hypothetical protein